MAEGNLVAAIADFTKAISTWGDYDSAKKAGAYLKLNLTYPEWKIPNVLPDFEAIHKAVITYYFASIDDELPYTVTYADYVAHSQGTADLIGDYNVSFNMLSIPGLNAASCTSQVKQFKGVGLGQVAGGSTITSEDDAFLFFNDQIPTSVQGGGFTGKP